MLIITDKETELDYMAKPENLIKRLPHWEQKFEAMAEMRKLTDDAAVTTSHGRIAGGKGMKIMARMPEALLTALLAIEPGLLKDAATFKRFMKKHPEYASYTGARY